MDTGTAGLLESVTHKTLHAQNFSRSSSQASHALTDLLSRYLSLLSTTCAQYAEHAGRSSVSVSDAVLALGELGVTVDDLSNFCEGEGREMARYASITQRRTEELAVLKETLTEGCRIDRSDALHLVYAEVPSPSTRSSSMMDEDEVEESFGLDEVGTNGFMASVGLNGRTDVQITTPPLPPSPISNPSTPPRKRARMANWSPPSHIPDFLPPYPTSNASPPPSPSPIKTEGEQAFPLVSTQQERPLTPPPQLSTSTSTSDYLTPVPYIMSSLSTASEAHLPDVSVLTNVSSIHAIQASQTSTTTTPTNAALNQARKYAPPEIVQSLVKAYHHVLTHPPPAHPQPNPARHRVAMALLAQMYHHPKWTPADTLFANLAAPRPRVLAPAPAYPRASESGADKGKEKTGERPLPLLPPSIARSLMANETVVPLSNQPTSRIPDIARVILPMSVYHRVTRILAPAALNSTSQEILTYHEGVPAPWNSTLSASMAAAGGPPKDALPNGKEKGKASDSKGADSDGAGVGKEPGIADAKLYATWDWEKHDYRQPLPPNRKGRVFGLSQPPSSAGGTRAGRPSGAGESRRPSISIRPPGSGGGVGDGGGPGRRNSRAGKEGKVK